MEKTSGFDDNEQMEDLVAERKSPQKKGMAPLMVAEKEPQIPEIPWDQWLNMMKDRQHLDETFIAINKKIRDLKGDGSTEIYYRPGLGGMEPWYLMEKIGAYGTMVSADPIFRNDILLKITGRELPIAEHLNAIQEIGGTDISLTLAKDYTKPGIKIPPEKYGTTQISKGGMATIDFKVNGVNLTIHILSEDMTKFGPDKYGILSFGQPQSTAQAVDWDLGNPNGIEYKVKAIQSLEKDGIITHGRGYTMFRWRFPIETYGFSKAFDSERDKIYQKKEAIGADLQAVYEIDDLLSDSYRVLAGYMANGESSDDYAFHENSRGEMITPEQIFESFSRQLIIIGNKINAISDETRKREIVLRIEELLMGPICTQGKIDYEKIYNIRKNPPDPADDDIKPYFENPEKLIIANNKGQIDIFEYYDALAGIFYSIFDIR